MGSHLPLRALCVFEAAARLGSFRAAADELGLTPSAVSHQIRALESGIGVQLFERAGRGVLLSHDGEEYYQAVRDGFGTLRRASERLSARGRSRRPAEIVRIHTPPSFANRWLLPRLSSFLADRPGIDIRVNAGPDRRFDAGAVDLAVVYGPASKWASQAVSLVEESIQPLCAPALTGLAQIRSPRDLLTQTLITTRGNLVGWEDWFRHHGIDPGMAARSIQLDPSYVAIDAAVKGLGIVLESDVLTADEIAGGRLVAPLPGSALTATSYWLVVTQPERHRPSVASVRDWLLVCPRRA